MKTATKGERSVHKSKDNTSKDYSYTFKGKRISRTFDCFCKRREMNVVPRKSMARTISRRAKSQKGSTNRIREDREERLMHELKRNTSGPPRVVPLNLSNNYDHTKYTEKHIHTQA